jgi:anti-sigma B factor antagonist
MPDNAAADQLGERGPVTLPPHQTTPAAFSVIDRGASAGTHVVAVEGELDIATAPRLKRVLSSALDGTSRLVVDLSRVSFIDSTALGVLVGIQRRLRSMPGGRMALVCTRPNVCGIFELAGLEGAFPMFADVDAAKAHVTGL